MYNIRIIGKLTLIITLKLFCSCDSNHPDDKSKSLNLEFENIDSLNSLSILFENAIIRGNHILWPIGYQDVYKFTNTLSSDNLSHTSIDTVLTLDNTYFVILRTDQYEKNKKADCHVCCPIISIANFEKNQTGYKLLNFKKFVFQLGGFGEYGTIEIDTLCVPVIKISSGWTGTGTEVSYDNYYGINDFSFIYGLTTMSSNGGYYNENEANYEEIKRTIINKNDSSFIVETIIIKNDSLNKKYTDKYFEEIKMFNDDGDLEIKARKLVK